jgi:hypothetical protein
MFVVLVKDYLMKTIFLIAFCFLSLNSSAQQAFKYGAADENICQFNGTLLSEYMDIDIEGNYTDSVKLYYSIEADSLVLYTVNNIKGLLYYNIYRKAIAVKDITLSRQDAELQKDGSREIFLYFFKITSAQDGMMRGTNYVEGTIEHYKGSFLYFAFSQKNKAFGEQTLALFKELFSK